MSASPAKAWAYLQARAALLGMQLLRSQGAAEVVTLVGSNGAAHVMRDANHLEDALAAGEQQVIA